MVNRTFKLEFKCDNAAFEDVTQGIEQALGRVQRAISSGATEGRIGDCNGNTIGSFALVEE